jgi:hypothetical protein
MEKSSDMMARVAEIMAGCLNGRRWLPESREMEVVIRLRAGREQAFHFIF